MAYKQWLDLFGRNSDDEAIRKALAEKGIAANTLEVERDDTSVYEDIEGEGITLVFTDEACLLGRDDMAIGEGAPILSEMNLFLEPEEEDGPVYSGPLPFQLKKTSSQASVRELLGEPIGGDIDPPWDQWIIDNFVLTLVYTDDLQSLESLGLKLPDA